jgi:hypothetical protein
MQFKRALPSTIANFQPTIRCRVVVAVLSLNLSAHVLANKARYTLVFKVYQMIIVGKVMAWGMKTMCATE